MWVNSPVTVSGFRCLFIRSLCNKRFLCAILVDWPSFIIHLHVLVLVLDFLDFVNGYFSSEYTVYAVVRLNSIITIEILSNLNSNLKFCRSFEGTATCDSKLRFVLLLTQFSFFFSFENICEKILCLFLMFFHLHYEEQGSQPSWKSGKVRENMVWETREKSGNL